MAASKVAVSIDADLIHEIDRLVAEEVFPSRSRAIQEAVREKVSRLKRTRLARESAKLDRRKERALAEEGLEKDCRAWPEY